ncbi:hypothetical protein DVH05_001458 [Phytophthora capsici]|nr:hypothetical protein DVH05_001458 [Phytophthora capsici]
MILHHQLEVPIPPRFLIQIMDARELAAFTDLFMAIEYPLYAHLLPGQRFGSNMTKQVILQHIHMGAEAAMPQKLQIQELKKDLSRVEINADTKVVKVTFKGKQTAMKWVGWGMPLAMKMLKLEDYETQREEAKFNNKLVKLDFYRFTIALKRGSMTSSDLYWVLTQKFGLKVQALTHVDIGGGSINDKQWRVNIKALACPAELRQLSTVEVDGAILTVYHHEVYSHWPCSTCGAPDHSGRFCKTLPDRVLARRAIHWRKAEGKLPSKRGQGGRDYSSREQPTSVEQLLAQLRGTNSGRKPGTAEQRTERSARKTEDTGRPTLPKEWEQSMRAQQDARPDQQDEARTQVEEGKQKGKQSEEPTAGDEQERGRGSEDAEAEGESYEYGDEDDAMGDSDDCEPTATNGNVDNEVHNAPMEDIMSERESENTEQEINGKTPTRHEPTFCSDGGYSRQKSLCPKRQLSENWKFQGDKERGKTCKAPKTTTNGAEDSRDEKIGYESEEVPPPPKNKKQIQQYMHSYVTTHAQEPEEALRKRTRQGAQADTKKLEEDGFLLTNTKRGDTTWADRCEIAWT